MSTRIYPADNLDFFFANEGPCGADWSQLQVTREPNGKLTFYIVTRDGIKGQSVVLDTNQQQQLANIASKRAVIIPLANITTRKR